MYQSVRNLIDVDNDANCWKAEKINSWLRPFVLHIMIALLQYQYMPYSRWLHFEMTGGTTASASTMVASLPFQAIMWGYLIVNSRMVCKHDTVLSCYDARYNFVQRINLDDTPYRSFVHLISPNENYCTGKRNLFIYVYIYIYICIYLGIGIYLPLEHLFRCMWFDYNPLKEITFHGRDACQLNSARIDVNCD